MERYSVYDLLRRIFLWEFPYELFTELIMLSRTIQNSENPDNGAAFRNYLKSIMPENASQVYREIHIEYTRLFVGPYHLPTPPYESVYRSPDQLMMQEQTMNVRAAYLNNEFQVIRINQEPDDHIGIELEFMCAMSKKSLDALDTKSFPRLAELIKVQLEFCNNHLQKWVPDFCRDIKNSSNSVFWENIAVFTQEFLEQDAADLRRLGENIDDKR